MTNGKSYEVARAFYAAGDKAGEQRVVLRGFSGTFTWHGPNPLEEGDRIHLVDGKVVRTR